MNANMVTTNHALELPATSKSTFQLWSFAPRLATGWALLGEISTKWVPVSTTRFENIADDSMLGLSARVKGPPGEKVHVSAVAPNSLKILEVECVIPQGGVALFQVSLQNSSCMPI